MMICYHNMPESFSAFWSIVSLTAAKTSRMFDVSVACVRLERISISILGVQAKSSLLRVEI